MVMFSLGCLLLPQGDVTRRNPLFYKWIIALALILSNICKGVVEFILEERTRWVRGISSNQRDSHERGQSGVPWKIFGLYSFGSVPEIINIQRRHGHLVIEQHVARRILEYEISRIRDAGQLEWDQIKRQLIQKLATSYL